MRRVLLAAAVGWSIALLVACNVLVAAFFEFFGSDIIGFVAFVNAIALLGVTAIAVGALIALRVPANPIGPVMIVGALCLQMVFVTWPLTVAAVDGDWAIASWLAPIGWFATVALVPSLYLLFVVVGLLYPNGHLPGPRWRAPFVLTTAALVAGEVMTTIAPWAPTSNLPPTGNPFALSFVPPEVAELGGGIAAGALFVGFALAVAGIVVQFRRADDLERTQIKWLVAALALMAVVFPISFGTDIDESGIFDVVAVLTGCLTPIAIGVAILRYRLYEIDRLVSRTVSWAIITGTLLAVFAGLVIGLQTLLEDVTQGGGTFAVAASTLVAAALFQPLRRRVQRAVDRRFDRARYDAEQTAAMFAERLRDEVDLETLTAELRATVAATVRPREATVWLPSRADR